MQFLKTTKDVLAHKIAKLYRLLERGRGHKVDPLHTTQISLKSPESEGAMSSLAFDATLWRLSALPRGKALFQAVLK